LYYDFNLKKFYNACDQNYNYFIAAEVAFFNNQYYFVSRNTGNLYAFDTIFTTYQDTDALGVLHYYEIPRVRICQNIRTATQDYFVLNDIGFTIESGETDYQEEYRGSVWLTDQSSNPLTDQSGNNLITQQGQTVALTPAVDLSLSYDGGAVFGAEWRYQLPAIGVRKNRLLWWQCGVGNDIVPQFKFWGIGRCVITDGIASIRE
jgi:hypothetical protein